MKIFLLIFLGFVSATSDMASNRDILVMFWNLENFFDWKDTGKGSSDKDFSTSGKRCWSASRFFRKCDSAAKAVLWTADKFGRMPDVIGVCEVENRGVLHKWLDASALRKSDYRIVHYDSHDRRGIDVALLYRASVFRYVSSTLKTPEQDGKVMQTRDILHVSLNHVQQDVDYHFIVNHHPSKFGGAKLSESKRYIVMQSLRDLCDSLSSVSDNSPIIAMGDFNDNPSGNQFLTLEGALVNKSLALYEQGIGTIRFQGKWDLIDMFLVDSLTNFKSSMYVVKIPFLMVWDNSYPGFKPLRTYSGPRYVGGVSDHCPIVLTISKE